MKAAIIYSGGNSADNQDTFIQAQEVEQTLNSLHIETCKIAFPHSLGALEESMRRIKPDFIFNLVETVNGTDELFYVAAAFFEYLNIPYTGCPASSLAVLSSKVRQKEIMRFTGLPTPENNTGPWIIKSDTEHASVGISADNIVETRAQADKKITEKQKEFGGTWFAEHYIDGREFNISILDDGHGNPLLLPPAEIIFENFADDMPKIVDYAAKWDPQSHAYNATPRRFDYPHEDNGLLETLNALCIKCWDVFDLKGAARVDYRVDGNNNPWILEVNANPCLSSDAGLMAAAARAGMSHQDVIERLLPH